MTDNTKPLTERSKYRLKIAANILKKNGANFDSKRPTFHQNVLSYIDALPPERKVALKQNVDWVEDYDRAVSAETQERPPGQAGQSRKATGRTR